MILTVFLMYSIFLQTHNLKMLILDVSCCLLQMWVLQVKVWTIDRCRGSWERWLCSFTNQGCWQHPAWRSVGTWVLLISALQISPSPALWFSCQLTLSHFSVSVSLFPSVRSIVSLSTSRVIVCFIVLSAAPGPNRKWKLQQSVALSSLTYSKARNTRLKYDPTLTSSRAWTAACWRFARQRRVRYLQLFQFPFDALQFNLVLINSIRVHSSQPNSILFCCT